ncbi:MAG: hypothetical protein ACLU4J_10735 [Butyricimonas paravirosa]
MNSQERVNVAEMFERGEPPVTNCYYEAVYLDYKAGKLSFNTSSRKPTTRAVNTDWFDLLCHNSISNKHTLFDGRCKI